MPKANKLIRHLRKLAAKPRKKKHVAENASGDGSQQGGENTAQGTPAVGATGGGDGTSLDGSEDMSGAASDAEDMLIGGDDALEQFYDADEYNEDDNSDAEMEEVDAEWQPGGVGGDPAASHGETPGGLVRRSGHDEVWFSPLAPASSPVAQRMTRQRVREAAGGSSINDINVMTKEGEIFYYWYVCLLKALEVYQN